MNGNKKGGRREVKTRQPLQIQQLVESGLSGVRCVFFGNISKLGTTINYDIVYAIFFRMNRVA